MNYQQFLKERQKVIVEICRDASRFKLTLPELGLKYGMSSQRIFVILKKNNISLPNNETRWNFKADVHKNNK